MLVLGVIPARGGSKGVPRKNVREVGGRPLLAWTVDVARGASDVLFRTVVSTDDDEIARVAREHGADVPWMRPADLGGDRVPMVPVLRHAVQAVEAEEGRPVDWVCLLQPTAPFRTEEDVRAAVALAAGGGCDSVISVVRVLDVHPVLMKRIESDRLLPFCVEEKEGTRRQDYAPPAYMRNGCIYLTRRDVLVERGSIWGDVIRPYVMPEERSVGIDNELQVKLVDLMLRERRGSPDPGSD
ncbi:MAG: acylneuraminate cytidylyltransferase family protein [Longimicrobiales bacterium]|nr:acylneuraminate cytidylyltransferase family protein [Longimicrobiales bacterium]